MKMARIHFPTECQGAGVPSGEISDVPFFRWDKNGVYSPAEQITELRQSAKGVYQPRRRSPKLRITASLSLRLTGLDGVQLVSSFYVSTYLLTSSHPFTFLRPNPFTLHLVCLFVSGLPL